VGPNIDAVRGSRVAPAVVVAGLVGSQAGHLLAFQLRFGSAAQHLESSGAHAYFPLVAKTAIGAVAVALLSGVFIIGLARMLAGGSRTPTRTGPKYIELLAVLFTIQLTCFICQEVGEALVAGSATDSAERLLLWGTLGQLPVAAVAAIALGWLWTRFESAAHGLRAVLAVGLPNPSPIAVAFAVWPIADGAPLALVMGGSLRKRGPPASSRLSL
jgi:hypothetical protein